MGLVLKRAGKQSLHLVKKKWKGVTHRILIVPLLIRPRGRERKRPSVGPKGAPYGKQWWTKVNTNATTLVRSQFWPN